jgi:hypothetical protein
MVFDQFNMTSETVSVNGAGELSNGFNSSPAISADGRYVAYCSDAANLPGANGVTQVYLFDRQLDVVRLISQSPAGAGADGDTLQAAICGDGRFVAFVALAQNLTPNTPTFAANVFVYDTQRNVMEWPASPTAALAAIVSAGLQDSITTEARSYLTRPPPIWRPAPTARGLKSSPETGRAATYRGPR